jgi:trimeric autotransporter adhesin
MNNQSKILLAILPVLACFALLPGAHAQCVDGCDSNLGTFQGDGALISNASGVGNAAFGWRALFSNTDASFNSAFGGGALALNDGTSNTAVGTAALLLNTTASQNVAVGTDALVFSNGDDNTGVGFEALELNVSAVTNAALGVFAGQNNDSSGSGLADFNTAVGGFALQANVDGTRNTAVGAGALEPMNGGSDNTAVGELAGASISTGSNNVCVGSSAGSGIITASNSIAIGSAATGPFADFSNTCFIGSIFGEPTSDPGTQTAVFVDQFNVVGIFNSSQKYKHDIQPMDKASEAIFSLKPVTFKFNSDIKGTTQYGLIAEDVAEANPELVVRKNGETITVRYEQINAMLLNEFLKEHKKVEEQQASISQLKGEMQTMVAQLKEQAAQIQKVSAQIQVSKSAPQVVINKP